MIEGVQTTIPFHLRVLDDEVFRSGKFGTAFVEDFLRRQAESSEKEAAS